MSNAYTTFFTAQAPLDQVLQAFLTGLDGSGAAVTLSGPNTIVVTRTYTPTWATIAGIIGLFFFLIGILAFFIKESEILTIALAPDADGSRTKVTISGQAGGGVVGRVNHLVAHYRRTGSSG